MDLNITYRVLLVITECYSTKKNNNRKITTNLQCQARQAYPPPGIGTVWSVLNPLSPVHITGDKIDSRQNRRQIGDKVDSRLCRRFVAGLSKVDCRRLVRLCRPCRSRHCRQSWTCSTRLTLSKVGNFCRPNVERTFDFVASVYGAKATRSTLSTFDKVDRVEFDFVASVYRAFEFRGNYSATSNNMKLVHWPLIGGLLQLVQRGGDWAGSQPAQASSLCIKCNSPSINGQCTNHRTSV